MHGLVIGKFLPVHNGHIALINFAASRCDDLIVSMSYTDRDPIDPFLRFEWIREIFHSDEKIRPAIVKDDFDDEALSLEERTKIWAEFIKRTYPNVDIIFTSEEYGAPLARHLGIRHVSFDPERKELPVSASRIRKNPFQHWDFIPSAVRPYFVKKICFYGPGSTGKSTIAKKMAEIFQTEFVPEVARELITSNDFSAEDIIRIGHSQTERVLEKTKKANKILFCDTDLITTQIYAKYYLDQVPPVLLELEKKVRYDLYFLFDIDTPWIADSLRDLSENRIEMFEIFRSELQKREIPATLVQGSYQERELFICDAVRKFLSQC